MSQRAVVVTCSDSVANGRAEDRSGPLAAELLAAAGWEVDAPVIVPDDREQLVAAVRAALAQGTGLVVTTGGTGLGPRDVTVDAIEGAGGILVPGVGEAIRAVSRERVPTTDLSRAGAFTLAGALVVCLPGSPGGVRDGLAVALPLAPHAVAMMAGGGHGDRHPHDDRQPHGDGGLVGAASVSEEPIDLRALIDSVASPAAGAVVTFEGRVRNHDDDRAVDELTYSAHPDAEAVLIAALHRAGTRPGVQAVAAAHRVGRLAIGDLAFAVVVSAGHRAAAFDTCAWLVDEVKRELPVWKLQRFGDGTEEWVNCA